MKRALPSKCWCGKSVGKLDTSGRLFSKASRLILHLNPVSVFTRFVKKNDLKNEFCNTKSPLRLTWHSQVFKCKRLGTLKNWSSCNSLEWLSVVGQYRSHGVNWLTANNLCKEIFTSECLKILRWLWTSPHPPYPLTIGMGDTLFLNTKMIYGIKIDFVRFGNHILMTIFIKCLQKVIFNSSLLMWKVISNTKHRVNESGIII